jgi:hypothetical protein
MNEGDEKTVTILLVLKNATENDTYASNTDVKEFSAFEGEEEVLFFPYSCFVVEKIEEQNNSGFIYQKITLSYMGFYKDKIREEYLKIKNIDDFLDEMADDKYFKEISNIKAKLGEGDLEDFKKEIKKLIKEKKEQYEKEEAEKLRKKKRRRRIKKKT